MAGKLKEKLESVGLAFLCLALGTQNPVESWGKGEGRTSMRGDLKAVYMYIHIYIYVN